MFRIEAELPKISLNTFVIHPEVTLMVPLKMVPDNSDFITHNVIKKAKMLYWLKTQTFSTKSHSRKRLSFLTTITF